MVALLRKSISLSKVKKGAKQRQSYRRRREIWPLTKSVSLKSNLRFQLTRHLMIYYIKNKKKNSCKFNGMLQVKLGIFIYFYNLISVFQGTMCKERRDEVHH